MYAEDVLQSILTKCEFRENRRSETHTYLRV